MNESSQKQIINNDKLLMSLQSNPTNKISYGIMSYYYCGYTLDYKILECGENFDKIVDCLKSVLHSNLKTNRYFITKYMIYEVEGINPRFVSYNIIKSSGCPHILVYFCPEDRQLIKYYGTCSRLVKNIHDKFSMLKNFYFFQEDINKKHKKELIALCKKKGIKKSFFDNKTDIIVKLIKNEASVFLDDDLQTDIKQTDLKSLDDIPN